MRFVVVAVALASCAEVPEPEDCNPTWGNSCSCTPQCLTDREIDRIREICLMECGEIDWTCTVVDDECAVVEP